MYRVLTYHPAIVILNISGYYDNLIAMMKRAVKDGFIGERVALHNIAVVVDDGDAKEAAAGTSEDFDWGKGILKPYELFSFMLIHRSRFRRRSKREGETQERSPETSGLRL